MPEKLVGTVEHYFPNVQAAVVRLDEGDLHLGDVIHILGHGHEITEPVISLEQEHASVREAHRGEDVAVHVDIPVHKNDAVYVLRSA